MAIILNLSNIRLNYQETKKLSPIQITTNGILKHATIAMPLKYLSNFWRSCEMPLINLKVELNLNRQSIVFCLQLVMIILIIMIMIMMVIILVLSSKTQNYIFLL